MTDNRVDPVCGMTVTAEPATINSTYDGQTYYFCAPGCREEFVAEPQRYLDLGAVSGRKPLPVILHSLKAKAPVVAPAPASASATVAPQTAASNAWSGDGAGISTPGLSRVDLPIQGMTCTACANHIERALNASPGVQQAHVNFATSKATVMFRPEKTDAMQLRSAVESAGYRVAETPVTESGLPDAKPGVHHQKQRRLDVRFWVAARRSRRVL